MCNPFDGGGGGGSSSSSSSTSSNQTTVNVTSNTQIPVSLNTTDLANAVAALAGVQQQGNRSQFTASVLADQTQLAVAQINAHAGPSGTTIILIIVAIAGLAFTAGLIKLPRGLRA